MPNTTTSRTTTGKEDLVFSSLAAAVHANCSPAGCCCRDAIADKCLVPTKPKPSLLQTRSPFEANGTHILFPFPTRRSPQGHSRVPREQLLQRCRWLLCHHHNRCSTLPTTRAHVDLSSKGAEQLESPIFSSATSRLSQNARANQTATTQMKCEGASDPPQRQRKKTNTPRKNICSQQKGYSNRIWVRTVPAAWHPQEPVTMRGPRHRGTAEGSNRRCNLLVFASLRAFIEVTREEHGTRKRQRTNSIR